MKKIINVIITIFISLILFTHTTYAASYDISVTSKSMTVGNTITLKITGNGVIGRFNISTNNSNASLSSTSIWVENNTQSITVKGVSQGSTTITVTPYSLSDTSENANEVNLSAKSITITINAKQTTSATTVTPKTKSSNNYLTSLGITGYTLNETFDKETSDYTVTLPAETAKMTITAQLADSSASVSETGEVNLTTGLNTLSVVVTAENGSKRTYTIKATVEELKPIEVTIKNNTYTMIRKETDLPKVSEYFIVKDLEYNGEKVKCYYNEKLDYTLVGLKDTAGNSNLYLYKDNNFYLYKEYTFNGTTIRLLDKEVGSSYKKTEVEYDGDKLTAYQEVKLDLIKNTYALDNNEIEGNKYYLFYGLNIETGKENLYQYDSEEKTIQRYNTELLDMYKARSDKYYLFAICSISAFGLLLIIFSIVIVKLSKKKRAK